MPKGFNKQFRKMLKQITTSQAEKAAKAAAQARASAARRELAAGRGGRHLGHNERPERTDAPYRAGPNDTPISSDRLPRPSVGRALASGVAGAAVTAGVGGLTTLTGSGPHFSRKTRVPQMGPVAPPSLPPQYYKPTIGPGSRQYPDWNVEDYQAARKSGGQQLIEPVVVGSRSEGHSPHIWATANRGNVNVTIEHTEYVRDIIMSSAAVSSGQLADCLRADPVNPGQTALFAWLADLANLFDSYEFTKLEFIYKPSVGTDQDGKLLMTFDPDVTDSAPTNKQQMLEARVQVDSPPYADAVLRVPKDILKGDGFNRLVRRGALPAGADQHFYDVGMLYVASPGTPAGTQGELFVRYKVIFRTPNGGTPQAGGCSCTNVSLAAPIGASASTSRGTLFPIRYNNISFKIPQIGIFKLKSYITGSGFTGYSALTPSSISATVIFTPGNGTRGINQSTALIQEFVIFNDSPDTVWTLGAPASATAISLHEMNLVPWLANVQEY